MSNVISFPSVERAAPVVEGAATLIERFKRFMETRRARAEHRRMLEDLLHEPDSVLADAGWTRANAMAVVMGRGGN